MFKIDLPGDRFEIVVLGCRSLVLVINNQILNKIKIMVKSFITKGSYISMINVCTM